MADLQMPGKGERKDFFISYTGKDSQWAQWIAFELEAAGYHTHGAVYSTISRSCDPGGVHYGEEGRKHFYDQRAEAQRYCMYLLSGR